jgi:hypothetical protein
MGIRGLHLPVLLPLASITRLVWTLPPEGSRDLAGRGCVVIGMSRLLLLLGNRSAPRSM